MKKLYFLACSMLLCAIAHAQIVCPNSIKTSAGSTPSTPTFVLNNGQGCTAWPSTITIDGTSTYNFVSCSGVNLKYTIDSGIAPSSYAMTVDFGGGTTCSYDAAGDLTVLSSKDLAKIEVTVWPNPTRHFLKFSLGQSNNLERINIFSISGKLVFDSLGKTEVNISNLANGLYILRLYASQGIVTRKLIKE
ncbi:T9SS type A sorting domain-containing protein [Hyunsoonleella aestuarii]|nr:T9SS type A sorting domain-containing protein [Hyunsoonleella aestuarii]